MFLQWDLLNYVKNFIYCISTIFSSAATAPATKPAIKAPVANCFRKYLSFPDFSSDFPPCASLVYPYFG